MRKSTIILLQTLALTGCLSENGFDTSASVSPGKSPLVGGGEGACRIDIPSYGTQILQNLEWSLNGDRSTFSFGVDHTRLSQFAADIRCGEISYEIALVNGNVTGQRTIKEMESYQLLRGWQTIGPMNSFVWSNLNTYQNRPVTFCIRARSEVGSSISHSLCNVLYRVPDFTPPSEPSCVEYRFEQRSYLTSNSVQIWCKSGGSKDSESTYISYSSAIFEGSSQLTDWALTDGYIRIDSLGLVPGRSYRLGLRAQNSDKVSSSVRYYAFYLPAEVSISVKYKSKSYSGNTANFCQASGKTLDNFISNFGGSYPGCGVSQQTQSSYVIDCTSYQTCSTGMACSSLPYLTTNSDYSCGVWNMPVLERTTY